MRMAAPNIQIGAGHVLIGIKAISATRDNGGSARVLPNLTITQGNTVHRLSPMPSVD